MIENSAHSWRLFAAMQSLAKVTFERPFQQHVLKQQSPAM
jgi:hypothetical protein